MKFRLLLFLLCAATFSLSAQKYTNTKASKVTKEWNGLTFSGEKPLFLNIENAPPFSKAAPLFKDKVIADDAMVTAFVMVNSSFSKLNETEEKALIGDTWKSFITYHIIPGRVDTNAIEKAIENGNGTAYFNTVLGQRLGAKIENDKLVLFDGNGNTANIIGTDYYHKNGFFHIINGLLLPSTEQ